MMPVLKFDGVSAGEREMAPMMQVCSQRGPGAPRLVTNVVGPRPRRVCDAQAKIARELGKIESRIQADLARGREEAKVRLREL